MAAQDSTAACLAALQRRRSEFTGALLAQNTAKGYRYGWAVFERWGREMGLAVLPATADTLTLFVTAQLARGLKVSTVAYHVAAIRHMHLGARHGWTAEQEIADVLRGARRSRGEQLHQVLPLTLDELRRIAVLLRSDKGARSVRNLAIILTGFTAALRNSSTAALLLSDVEFTEKGVVLHIRKEKTDQESKGRLIGISHGRHPETDAVAALAAWITLRGDEPGPLFCRFDRHLSKTRALNPERIGQLVQSAIRRIGLDPKAYGGHSLRAAYVTEAAIAGATDLAISSTTGHRSMVTVRRYFRKRDAFIANPLSLMDL